MPVPYLCEASMFEPRQWIFSSFIFLWILSSGVCEADQRTIQAQSKSLAHYIMGVMDDLNGDSKNALLEYQKSTKFDSKAPMPHLKLSAYFIRNGHIKEAQQHLKTAVKLKPDLSQAHYLLALIYSSQKKYNLAASEYEAILRLASTNSPDNFEIHAYLAQLYYAQLKYPQAIEQLNQILVFNPKNVSALFLLASINLDLGRKEQAKENLRKVVSIDPDHAEALNSLAYIYAEEGTHLTEALKMSRHTIELDSTNGAYYDTLGWVLFKQGFNAEGLMTLEKALNYITDPIIYAHMGDVYIAMGKPALARKFWLKSLDMNSHQPQLVQKLENLNKSSAKNQHIDNLSVK